MEDFPVARNLLEADVDMPHLTAIEQARERILRSPCQDMELRTKEASFL